MQQLLQVIGPESLEVKEAVLEDLRETWIAYAAECWTLYVDSSEVGQSGEGSASRTTLVMCWKIQGMALPGSNEPRFLRPPRLKNVVQELICPEF